MPNLPWMVHEAEHRSLLALCAELGEEASAQAVLLLAPTGELVCQWGGFGGGDVATLGALAAGAMAASGALARVLGTAAPSQVLHETDGGPSLHLSEVDGRAIVVVVFDQRAALGLVRLRVSQCAARLAAALPARRRGPVAAGELPALISDQDIDNLFGD